VYRDWEGSKQRKLEQACLLHSRVEHHNAEREPLPRFAITNAARAVRP
jgi:hypothetical protein